MFGPSLLIISFALFLVDALALNPERMCPAFYQQCVTTPRNIPEVPYEEYLAVCEDFNVNILPCLGRKMSVIPELNFTYYPNDKTQQTVIRGCWAGMMRLRYREGLKAMVKVYRFYDLVCQWHNIYDKECYNGVMENCVIHYVREKCNHGCALKAKYHKDFTTPSHPGLKDQNFKSGKVANKADQLNLCPFLLLPLLSLPFPFALPFFAKRQV